MTQLLIHATTNGSEILLSTLNYWKSTIQNWYQLLNMLNYSEFLISNTWYQSPGLGHLYSVLILAVLEYWIACTRTCVFQSYCTRTRRLDNQTLDISNTICHKLGKIFTGLMYRLLLSISVIAGAYRYFISNKTRSTRTPAFWGYPQPRFCPQTDRLKPVYPPFNFVEAGGITMFTTKPNLVAKILATKFGVFFVIYCFKKYVQYESDDNVKYIMVQW